MTTSAIPTEMRCAGLAVAQIEEVKVTQELEQAIPAGSRVVHAHHACESKHVIRELLMGRESCVVGHSQQDLIGDLLIMLAPLKRFGSIRRVCILGKAPSVEAESIAAKFGLNWTESESPDGTAIAFTKEPMREPAQSGLLRLRRD
jgi:hypothetical protein